MSESDFNDVEFYKNKCDRLDNALIESLNLQNHYAKLLNAYDGGERITFSSVDSWLKRLDEIK